MRVYVVVVWALLELITRPARADEIASPTWDDVSSIFEKRCTNCHAQHGASKGLRLDSYAAILAGSENGPVITPGAAAQSELVRRLSGESTPRFRRLAGSRLKMLGGAWQTCE